MTQTPKIKSEEEMREEWEEYSTSFRFVFNDSDTPDYWLNIIKERERGLVEEIKEYLLAKHIHFDKLDPWEFEDERPYVDSLKLENFILSILKQTK